MIRSVPGLEKIADISGEQVANVDSSHMTDELMLTLLRRINELLKTDAVDGIVVTHGTDTLEETAYFLSLTVKSSKPVVIVGSMRPATAISADGPLNLYNAVVLAADKRSGGRGVLVTLNETIHSARYVTKTNTTSVDTFRSPDFGSLGYVHDGRPYFYQTITKRHTVASEFDPAGMTSLPRVDIIYGHSNGSRNLVDGAAAAGSSGYRYCRRRKWGYFPQGEGSAYRRSQKRHRRRPGFPDRQRDSHAEPGIPELWFCRLKRPQPAKGTDTSHACFDKNIETGRDTENVR